MKKYLKLLKIIIFSLFFVMIENYSFSQQFFQTEQILVPRKVYIGDSAQLQCSFNSDLENLENLKKNEFFPLSLEGFESSLNSKDYEIKNVQITKTNTNFYTLIITFVPWKIGFIKFPDYDISKNFGEKKDSQNPQKVSFNEIEIVSITQQNSITTPRAELPPILLPGTTYKIYIVIIILLILFFLIIQVLIRHKKIATFFKTKKLLRKYKKNKKITIKSLLKLKDENISDKEISEKIQKLMRNYLSTRFEFSFLNCTSSEIMNAFYKATNNLASEKKESAVCEIVGIFIRTDFIRFSNNSYKNEKSQFLENEKITIIDNLIKNIELIEESENQNKKEEKNV